MSEIPASKQFFAWKNNLKSLGRHSEQERGKQQSNTKEQHFPTNYVYTNKDNVAGRGKKFTGI